MTAGKYAARSILNLILKMYSCLCIIMNDNERGAGIFYMLYLSKRDVRFKSD